MASYNTRVLLAYLQGPGAKVQATLQAHCYAAMPGITAKQCSPARALYRAMGNGANANGHTRYPVQSGAQYHAQLTAGVAGTAPNATAAKRQALAKQQGKVWAASKAGARQAKRQAKQHAATQQPTQAS